MEKYMLHFVKQCLGKITNKSVSQLHHSPSFTYAIYNRQALDLLNQIQPYLKSYKSKRCTLVFKDYLELTPSKLA
jgi:hypothetical protein